MTWLPSSSERLYLCTTGKLLKHMSLTLTHPKQAGASIHIITWHTHTLQEQDVQILRENDPWELFGLTENYFDVTGAKFFLQVNAQPGWVEKLVFIRGEEKQLPDFQAVCLLSWHKQLRERTEEHKAAPFCTMREFSLVRESKRMTDP